MSKILKNSDLIHEKNIENKANCTQKEENWIEKVPKIKQTLNKILKISKNQIEKVFSLKIFLRSKTNVKCSKKA